MRKITEDAVEAFMEGRRFKRDNTEVRPSFNGWWVMFLFGSIIAARHKDSKDLYIRTAGYLTRTTKERLNGLPGVHIQQRRGEWYMNGTNIDRLWQTPPQDMPLGYYRYIPVLSAETRSRTKMHWIYEVEI